MKQQEILVPVCGKCALETGSIFKNLSPEEVDLINYKKEFRTYRR